jgi:hypothetical protein
MIDRPSSSPNNMNARSVGAPDLVGIVIVSLYQTDEATVAKFLINRLECDHFT